MEQLIPVINKLQDVFATVGYQPIDLPQIAVVGSQSVGKSSVLENIVGRDFLPRGNEIVTRRPLTLQLINTRELKESSIKNDEKENDKNLNEEWGEFLHIPNKKFFDFNDIRKEIEKETDRIAPNKNISDQPINLKIFSPHVLNLTLVDLPGITKVAVGDQPLDIEKRVRKVVLSFIEKPRCLILAVSAATSDLSTSDAIQLAKQVDPLGVRTLGVITKIDLMDQGTNALDILAGKIIPLQLGYVGVVNRSQKDINNRKSIQEALKAEELFFKTHTTYRSIAPICGIPYLTKKLNQILINHIKKTLPELQLQINNYINELQNELDNYGPALAVDQNNKGALLLHLISKFSENFQSSIDGNGVTLMNHMQQNKTFSNNQRINDNMISNLSSHYNSTKEDIKSSSNQIGSMNARELFGGARILYIFRNEFQRALSNIKPFDGLNDDFILSSMRNASGIRSSLFIPEMCFENLVKMQIEKLRRPCINCIEMVYEELKRISGQCETPDITRFPKFRTALRECVLKMLKRHLEPCRNFGDQLIDVELAYINTNHPDFISMDDVFTDHTSSVTNTNNNVISDTQSVSGHTSNNINSNSFIPQNVNKEKVTAKSQVRNAPPVATTSTKQKKASNGMFSAFFPMNNDSTTVVKSNLDTTSEYLEAPPIPQTVPPPLPQYTMPDITQREYLELHVIKRFIDSYYEIVKKNIQDCIPKAIMLLLINRSKERLQQDLALTLYKEDQFEELLSESPEIAQKRKAALDLLAILQRALDIVNEIKDYKLIDN